MNLYDELKWRGLINDITSDDVKDALNNGKLTVGESIGVSNEQIEPKATIEVKNGILIIIYSKD